MNVVFHAAIESLIVAAQTDVGVRVYELLPRQRDVYVVRAIHWMVSRTLTGYDAFDDINDDLGYEFVDAIQVAWMPERGSDRMKLALARVDRLIKSWKRLGLVTKQTLVRRTRLPMMFITQASSAAVLDISRRVQAKAKQLYGIELGFGVARALLLLDKLGKAQAEREARLVAEAAEAARRRREEREAQLDEEGYLGE